MCILWFAEKMMSMITQYQTGLRTQQNIKTSFEYIVYHKPDIEVTVHLCCGLLLKV